uniref:Uncharacterized protein n=1 Tax=Arundo donax TaxID=35708 RepID=A0A0A9EB69_ARUDO
MEASVAFRGKCYRSILSTDLNLIEAQSNSARGKQKLRCT